MMSLVDYLTSTKAKFVNNLNTYLDIHIVIGNESCDLDSTASSLALAYFLDKYKTSPIPKSALVIPVLNVSREYFQLRTEVYFVLQECGITMESLIYRDEIDLKDLLKTKHITSTLVDHHVLSENDILLQPTVIQIFDHRPIDANSNWTDKNVEVRIEEVGSCSTLIADEIFHTNESLLIKDLGYVIYETIIYDTIALIPENGKAKELDLSIAKKLEGKFCFSEGRDFIFNKLWTVHNDVSYLSPKQLLLKDLKTVENIPVPGLPMLAESFFKLKDAYNAVEDMATKYEVSLLVLVGIDATNGVKRDIAIFWRNDGNELKDLLVAKLINSEELKGYNFCFEEVILDYNNVTCLKQNNVKLSRKQIIPLIKDAIEEYGKLKV